MEKINILEVIKNLIEDIKMNKNSFSYYVKDEDNGNFYSITGIDIIDGRVSYNDGDYIYFDKDTIIYRMKEND